MLKSGSSYHTTGLREGLRAQGDRARRCIRPKMCSIVDTWSDNLVIYRLKTQCRGHQVWMATCMTPLTNLEIPCTPWAVMLRNQMKRLSICKDGNAGIPVGSL